MAGDFICQAAVVFEAGRNVRDVVFRFDDGLSCIAALQLGEMSRVLPDFFRKLEKDAPAVLRGRRGPRAGIKRRARGPYRQIDVGWVRRGNLGDDFLQNSSQRAGAAAANFLAALRLP